MNEDVNEVLEKISSEIKMTVNGMFEALGAFNARLERIEKWITEEEGKSQK